MSKLPARDIEKGMDKFMNGYIQCERMTGYVIIWNSRQQTRVQTRNVKEPSCSFIWYLKLPNDKISTAQTSMRYFKWRRFKLIISVSLNVTSIKVLFFCHVLWIFQAVHEIIYRILRWKWNLHNFPTKKRSF